MTKKKHVTIKNPNNYLGYKLNNNYILNLNEMIFWTYILIFFLQNALRKNSRVLFATKFKFQQRIFNFLIKNSRLQLQLLKIFTQWVGGCLSNFLSIRWFYLFNRVKFYRQCPDILVLLEKKAADPLISEAYIMNIPVISYTSFTQEDPQLSYLLVGGNLGLDSKKNNFFFFVYLLKNMLVLESSLKKKKILKTFGLKKKARRKPFFRVKKNRAYRLFGSRQFSIWRSHTRFNLKLKLLKIKFQLLEKILLRNFKMNKHFFKKRSTLAFIERLKSANYSIKCRKNIRFFFIIEGRLLVVLARMYIVRIVKQIELRILITQGYISVDNEIVKNPLYLTRHNSILRVLKRIPRIFSKLPKSLLLNNLKWLFYKRNRKKKRRRLTKLAGTKRI
jgi:ribosomal protein S2